MFGLDWNTLIVGKLSLWIQADSEIETERRNSEAVSFSLWILSDLMKCFCLNLYPHFPPHLFFSAGSGTGAELLSLSWSSCLHDPSKWPP